MSSGPIKLAALLKDEAEAPQTPAASPVSLNVLQDAGAPPIKRMWQRHLLRVAAAFVVVIILGVFVNILSELKSSAPAQQVRPQVQSKETPAKQKPTELTPSGLDEAAFSKPVQELMKYVQCLRKGQCSFNPRVTGEDAAKQFGYSRLFASAYEEMILQQKGRESKQERPRLTDIVASFEVIVQEEQTIDQLLARKERHIVAIAYLRALQNGDVVFPGPQAMAPAPSVLLVQLRSAYPDVKLNIDDPIFAALYRQMREYAAERLTTADEVFAQEIIAGLRRLIVKSSTIRTENTPQTICEKGEAVGELIALTRACPRLRLSEAAMKLSNEIAQQQTGLDCRNKAASNLKVRLDTMSASEIAETCERAQLRTQAGTTDFLEMAN